MKTSTAFACNTPQTEHDLHLLIQSLLEVNEEYKKDYGLQKVFSKELNDYIGVVGIIRCDKKIKGYKNIVVEGIRFLKSKYIGKGIGELLDLHTARQQEKLNIILVATTWEGHASSNHLLQKYGMMPSGTVEKVCKSKTININLYIKFPSSIKNFIQNIDVASFLVSKKNCLKLANQKPQEIF